MSASGGGSGRSYLEIGLSMVLVGGSVVAGKLALAAFPVFLLAGIRFAVASAVLVPWLVVRDGGWHPPGRRALGALFGQALAGVFLFNILFLYGLTLTGGAEAGIVTATTPAAVAGLAFVALRERPRARAGASILLAAGGIGALYVMAPAASPGAPERPWLGDGLIFGAVLAEAAFTVLGRALAVRLDPLAMSAWTSLFGLGLFLPLAVYQGLSFDFGAPSAGAWALLILYFGIGLSVLSYLLWYAGLRRVSAAHVGILGALVPLSAVVLSYLFLGERAHLSHLVGAALVVAAIAVIAPRHAPVRRPG